MRVELTPLADEWTEDYSLLQCSIERVTLSAPVRAFLHEARANGVRPILLTPESAHLSWFVADELRFAGGYWAVHTRSMEVYDARSGYRIRSFPGLWRDFDQNRMQLWSLRELNPRAQGAFFFDVFTRERAVENTLAGGVAEHMVAGLGGGGLVRWDVTEPLANPWSRRDATMSMRYQMPASERHLARSDRDAAVSITVSRTRTGLLEHTRGLVPVGAYDSPVGLAPQTPLAMHPAITHTLQGLTDRFRVNVAMISYCEVVEDRGSLGQEVARRRPDMPLAVLVGALAVRDLQIEIEELAKTHDVMPLGLSRAPNLLVRFSGRDDLWHQLLGFAHDLDQERLAAALASEFDGIVSLLGRG